MVCCAVGSISKYVSSELSRVYNRRGGEYPTKLRATKLSQGHDLCNDIHKREVSLFSCQYQRLAAAVA